ncbi:putative defense protein 3 [Mya arenaria]|uniref:putative defense protein 3 n=1 Tax=Mya arenaria TaxID=6604 RepID=UPI0022E03C4F|nr:putative defense protein 3 [Mya arenaria]
MIVTKIILLTTVIGYITAFPSGAPANICGRYVPGGHRNMGTPIANGPRTGPYSVAVTPAGNGVYTVTLSATSNQPFRGFVLQAMQSWKQLPDGPSDIVGVFQPDFQSRQSQMRSCGGMGGSNVLTHTSRDDKTQMTVSWQAPANLPDPNVKFVATVVQNYDNFYVVHSDPINIQGQGQGQTTFATQGPSTTGEQGANGFVMPGTTQTDNQTAGQTGSTTGATGNTGFGGFSSFTGYLGYFVVKSLEESTVEIKSEECHLREPSFIRNVLPVLQDPSSHGSS